jgi:hypothetical protein
MLEQVGTAHARDWRTNMAYFEGLELVDEADAGAVRRTEELAAEGAGREPRRDRRPGDQGRPRRRPAQCGRERRARPWGAAHMARRRGGHARQRRHGRCGLPGHRRRRRRRGDVRRRRRPSRLRFLAENADFAQAVLDAGLVWVEPSPATPVVRVCSAQPRVLLAIVSARSTLRGRPHASTPARPADPAPRTGPRPRRASRPPASCPRPRPRCRGSGRPPRRPRDGAIPSRPPPTCRSAPPSAPRPSDQ